jgi:hypothetical protein
MKALISSGLCLALGAFVTSAFAQEIQWRRPNSSQPAARPAPVDAEKAIASSPVERVSESVRTDSEIRPTAASFRPLAASPTAAVFRGKAQDDTPRPLPAGPALRIEPVVTQKKSEPELTPEQIPVKPSLVKPVPADETLSLFGSEGMVLSDPSECVICTDCCDPCDLCCPTRPSRFWFSAEYLLWNFREQDAPPLVTTSPAGTPRAAAGVLGFPTTTVLFGDDELENDLRSGGRFTVGFWLPRRDGVGLEASYFFTGRREGRFSATSAGVPILARPIVNAVTGANEAQLVAFPGVVSGNITVDHSTRLWGVEANLRHQRICGPRGHLDLLCGYRHVNLDEYLEIREQLSAVNPLGGPPTGILVSDRFGTQNHFHGAQLGLDFERRFWQRWFWGGQVKVALGSVEQVVNIGGNTLFFPPPPALSSAQTGGLLALPTNIGRHSHTHFAVVPEVELKIGFDLSERLRLYVAYDFLYISNVVRPGDQIDLTVNRSQIPNITGPQPLVGPARPAVLFQRSDFWAQGVNFGLEYRY